MQILIEMTGFLNINFFLKKEYLVWNADIKGFLENYRDFFLKNITKMLQPS